MISVHGGPRFSGEVAATTRHQPREGGNWHQENGEGFLFLVTYPSSLFLGALRLKTDG